MLTLRITVAFRGSYDATAAGYDARTAHEFRRVDAFSKAYDKYLRPNSGIFVNNCTICRATSEDAEAELRKWSDDNQTLAKFYYNKWVRKENDQIEFENKNKKYDGKTFLGFSWVHTVGDPPEEVFKPCPVR